MKDLDGQYQSGLANCRIHDIITSHSAFEYLAKRYNFNQISVTGLSPDAEPSSQKIAEISYLAKNKNIKYIFFETLVSPKISQTIANEIGAQAIAFNPLEGLTKEEINSGKTYLSEMQNNLVIVGSEGKQNLKNTFLMQLNSKGEIDSRFGKEGLHFSFGSDEEIHGLGLDHTGFVMAGFFKNHTRDFLFVKINSDGNLNSTFGKNIFSGQNKKGELHYIDQNDSGWLAAGFSHKLGKSDFSLVRINAEGGPDLNFGYQGVVTLKHGSKDHLYGVTTLSDGTIAATGSALNKGKENCVVVRLSKKGELLSSFGVGGFVFLPSTGWIIIKLIWQFILMLVKI